MDYKYYSTISAKEAINALNSDFCGLSEKAAGEILKKNPFRQHKKGESMAQKILARQIKSAFFFLLFAAGLISFFVGEKTSGSLIFLFLAINLLLGFFQEYRAERSIKLLETYIAPKARVLRSGTEKLIDKNEIGKGDIVLLEAGEISPADLRLVKNANLTIDESVLTGESAPVAKTSDKLASQPNDIYQAKNIVFAGTSVVSGKAEGLAIAGAGETQYGAIENMASESKKQSAYEKNLSAFSIDIFRIVIVTIILFFAANLIINGSQNFTQFLVFCIALMVGIIPEALPAVTIFALSQGALKLARHKVVAKRLAAIESLGNIDILCTDKTGTLTENRLKLVKTYSKPASKCQLYGLAASSAIKEEIESRRDPFDLALIEAAPKTILADLKKITGLHEIAFNPERAINSALIQIAPDKRVLIARGAPEAIIKLCSKFPKGTRQTNLQKNIAERGKQGCRVLAVAAKEFKAARYTEKNESGLEFIGYFVFEDPLKKTAQAAVESAKKLNVNVKILTGDSLEVAESVGRQIGVLKEGEAGISGSALESLPTQEFLDACQKYNVFARVSPKMKYTILSALQQKHEVGFLGEGINDIPSLKTANASIAVATASSASKEAADIVLLNNDLKTVVEGIRRGRNVFANIQKYIKCTIASNFGNCYSMAIISLGIPFLPMLPTQILLLNLLSDFPLISVVFDSVDSQELRKPKFYSLKRAIPLIVILGAISSLFDFIFFYSFVRLGEQSLQTLWFIASTLTEIALIFSVRTCKPFWKAKKPATALSVLAIITIITVFAVPLTDFGKQMLNFINPPLWGLALIIMLVVIYFTLSEAAKLAYYRFAKHHIHKTYV